MSSFLKIFTILTPKQIRRCALLVLTMFIGAVMEAVGIGVLYPLIRIINTPNFLDTHERLKSFVGIFGIHTHGALIIFSSVCLILFYLFKNVFILLRTRFECHFTTDLQRSYVTRLFGLYLYKPYLYRININTSILARNIGISGSVFNNVLTPTLDLIAEAITFVIIWAVLLITNWLLTVVIILVLGPLTFMVMRRFRDKLVDYGTRQKKYMAEQNKWSQQGFRSLKETKVMQNEDFFMEQFAKVYNKYTDINRHYNMVQRFPRCFVELMGMGGILMLVITQILVGADPVSLVPSLGVFALAATRLMPSINRIIGYYNMMKFNIPNLEEIYDDLMLIRLGEDKAERGLQHATVTRLPFTHSIEVKGLSFRYPNTDKDVLDKVSFTIPHGGFVGIVGPSGAGKTTFVDILLGLLPPTGGLITVDGVDLQSNTAGWLKNIAYVPQKIYLIDASIRENVTLGTAEKDIDEERLNRAMAMAEILDFVETMPKKALTRVGEEGCHLSGGQKQRIGIARALYRDPDVLVLDEATSALDSETEASITHTILKLKSTITIISIAHRLSTLEECDFKVRFDGGKATIVS